MSKDAEPMGELREWRDQTALTLAVHGVEEKVGECKSREDAGVIERAEDVPGVGRALPLIKPAYCKGWVGKYT